MNPKETINGLTVEEVAERLAVWLIKHFGCPRQAFTACMDVINGKTDDSKA